MEQPTIIETTLPIRRGSLLHIALKIYIWVGMVIPFFSFLYLLTMIKSALLFNEVFYVGDACDDSSLLY